MSDIEFLYSIADLGESDQDDVSERDEEILASEVDPIRGWHVDDSSGDSKMHPDIEIREGKFV